MEKTNEKQLNAMTNEKVKLNKVKINCMSKAKN